MSGDAIAPFKDTQTIFRKLKALPENKTCFDCPIKNPTWCTIPYGAFVCLGTVLTISYIPYFADKSRSSNERVSFEIQTEGHLFVYDLTLSFFRQNVKRNPCHLIHN